VPANVDGRLSVPFPARGSQCRDWWSDDETERIRQQIADADARTAAIAAAWQREERRERKRRDRERTRHTAGQLT